MNLLIWLDIPLIVLGLSAMTPWVWRAFRRRRSICLTGLHSGPSLVTELLFYVGLCILVVACLDAGLAKWTKPHHFTDDLAELRVSMEAPDFALPLLDEDATLRLSDFRGQKPVLLVFGNFY